MKNLSAPLLLRMEAANEQDWLPAARRGEAWALERFYYDHQQTVYTLCYRLLGRSEDAEDATQSTFVRAFGALPRFRADCAAKTWVYRIAVNEAMSLLRRRSGAPLPIDGGGPSMEKDLALPDGSGAVAERVAIRGALTRVKPDHRAILVLRFWEEMSYEEIAEVLGVSLPAVKMRLKRAKEEFRVWYEGQK